MVHLKTVSVAGCVHAGVSQAALNQVSIAEAEVTGVETQRHRQRETIFPNAPAWKWLHADVYVVRRDRHVLAEAKREARANAFVNGMTEVAANAKCAENVEVEVFGYWRSNLDVAPELVIRPIYLPGRFSHKDAQKAQNN